MEQVNTDYDGHTEFLEEVGEVLVGVGDNMNSLLATFSSPPAFLSLEEDVARLMRETAILKVNMESGLTDPHKATAMAQEVKFLKEKNRSLQAENQILKDRMDKMKLYTAKVRNNMRHQTEHCALLGANLSSHLWKATRNHRVVSGMLIGEEDIEEFMNILSLALASFMDTYIQGMPSARTKESKYVVAMCAIYTNLAVFPDSRQYLMGNPKGKAVFQQFIHAVPEIPLPSGNSLMKILLMVLFNMSINEEALEMMTQEQDVLKGISKSLQEITTEENNILGLRLLKSLCYGVKTDGCYSIIEQTILMEQLKTISSTGTREIKTIVNDIFGKLELFKQMYPTTNRQAFPTNMQLRM